MALTPCFSVVFSLGLTFESLKELGARHPEWCKSFGIGKFDKEMVEKELFEGCEKACLHQLNVRCKQH
jgi:hypothetical protein